MPLPPARPDADGAAWRAGRWEILRLVDGLGKPVDPGIRRVVVALRVHGFLTSGSCQGHADRGLEPWIDVTARPYGAQGEREKWIRLNHEHQARFLRLLEGFDTNRDTQPELVLAPKGVFGGFRLQSAWVAPMGSPRRPAQPDAIAAFLEEMDEFAAYLESLPIDSDVAPVVGTLRPHQPRPA